MTLKISLAGIRGIVGKSLTAELLVSFAQSFATYCGEGKIALGGDGRSSYQMAKNAVISGLLAAGAEVIDLGFSTTPLTQFAVVQKKCVGGIEISAGHNTENWNALKFINNKGLLLNFFQAEENLDVYHQQEYKKVYYDKFKKIIKLDLTSAYLDFIFNEIKKIIFRDLHFLKKKLIVVDCVNGSLSPLANEFFKLLPCKTLIINNHISKPFPHLPEPNEFTMIQLHSVVNAAQADIGFMVDSSGERLGIVTKDFIYSSENTFLAAIYAVLSCKNIQFNKTIITNYSTTLAVEDLAYKFKAEVLRVPVSQGNVANEVLNQNAVLGGEGSGAILFSPISFSFDSLIAMCLVLNLFKEFKNLTLLFNSFPKYYTFKKVYTLTNEKIFSILFTMRKWFIDEFANNEFTVTDGIRVSNKHFFIHLRSSITEPCLRLIIEAKSEKKLKVLSDKVVSKLEEEL